MTAPSSSRPDPGDPDGERPAPSGSPAAAGEGGEARGPGETGGTGWSSLLGALLFGALLGGGGYVLGSLAGNGAGGDGGSALGPGAWAAFLAGLAPVLFLVLLAHELGHVLAGRLARFRFFLLVVGPLRVDRRHEGLRLSLNRSPALAGGLAATGPESGDVDDLRRRSALMVAGGPAASLLLAGGALALFYLAGLGGITADTAGSGAVVAARLLWLLGLASAGIAVVTLIPGRTSGFLTDGARLVQILRGGPAGEADVAMQTLLAWSMAGIRPESWDEEVVDRALQAPPGPFRALARHLAWQRAAARNQDAEEAHQRAALLRHLEEAPGTAQGAILLDVATERALAGEVDEALRLLERAASGGPLADPHALPLARAAVAAARGRFGEAREQAARAEALLPRAMAEGERLRGDARLARLRRGMETDA